MKKLIASVTILALLASCGGSASKKDKLLKDRKEKVDKISSLKAEIATIDTELNGLDSSKKIEGKPVMITPVVLGTFQHSIDIQGRIDAEQSVAASPQMPGIVKSINVSAGDQVGAGQVLATLDDDIYVRGLSELQTQLDFAKNIFDKQKSLWDQKIGSEVQFLQAKNNVDALEKKKSTLQEQLDMTRIKAPLAGTVDMVGLKVGEMASPGMTTINIVNVSKLKAKGEVAEGYIAKVKKGAPVKIVLPDANKTIDATVTYSGQIINKVNRTFSVEVFLNAGEADVHPNMVAVMKIIDYKNDQAVSCSLSAVQQGADGKTFVYVAAPNKDGKLAAERREITYTRTYNGTVEIATGLKVGDQLITEGYNDLNAGDLVQSK